MNQLLCTVLPLQSQNLVVHWLRIHLVWIYEVLRNRRGAEHLIRQLRDEVRLAEGKMLSSGGVEGQADNGRAIPVFFDFDDLAVDQ